MKREYVIPDLLASLTANALFGGSPHGGAVGLPTVTEPSAMQCLTRWFKRAPQAAAADSPSHATARHTLTDDWAGGWYARTRLLQAATLAQQATASSAADSETSTNTTAAAPGAGARRAS